MGTRNLQVVVVGCEVKVGQYGQWDGSPGSQGMKALQFLRDQMNFEVFKQKVLQCSWISPEEHKKLWVNCGAAPDSDMVDMKVSNKFSKLYPELHRDCGANIYSLIQDSAHGLKLQNDIEFAGDSVFCEWAYVVDMDKNTFEVYKGFNEKPLKKADRFHYLQKGGEYYPVKIAKSYSLSNLPSNEDFLNDFKTPDDEE